MPIGRLPSFHAFRLREDEHHHLRPFLFRQRHEAARRLRDLGSLHLGAGDALRQLGAGTDARQVPVQGATARAVVRERQVCHVLYVLHILGGE